MNEIEINGELYVKKSTLGQNEQEREKEKEYIWIFETIPCASNAGIQFHKVERGAKFNCTDSEGDYLISNCELDSMYINEKFTAGTRQELYTNVLNMLNDAYAKWSEQDEND